MPRVAQQYAEEWLEGEIDRPHEVYSVDYYHKKARFKRLPKPRCKNCGLETDVLFDGFKFSGDPKVIREMDFQTLTRLKVYSAGFNTEFAKVCMRCRPASNLEIEEIPNGQ